LKLRQHAEQSCRGAGFLFRLHRCGRAAMNRKVTDVDLDDVMQQEHLHDAIGIHRAGGILIEQQRIHGEVPGVFSGIFLPAAVEQR